MNFVLRYAVLLNVITTNKREGENMSTEAEAVKALTHGLEGLCKFIFSDHKDLIEKTAKRARKQIDSVDNIVTMSKDLVGVIPQFVSNLMQDPQKNVKVAKEFKEKGEKVVQEANKVMKRHDKIVKSVTPVLTSLVGTLKSAFDNIRPATTQTIERGKGVVVGLKTQKDLQTKKDQSAKQHAQEAHATPPRRLTQPPKGGK